MQEKKTAVAKCPVCGKILFRGDKAYTVIHFLQTEIGLMKTHAYCDTESCAEKLKQFGMEELQKKRDFLAEKQKEIEQSRIKTIQL